MIESYRFGLIVIEGNSYTSDVLLLPSGVRNWRRLRWHELSPNDLDEVISEKPEVLVIGTGASGMVRVPPETREYLESQGIELMAEATDRACDTYNQLCRLKKVAAALHLTC